MKVTDETPLFYRVVLKNAKGVIHVQDCDFPPTEDDYDGEVLSVTPLYTYPQPKQKPVGYADAESVAYLLEGGDSGILIVPEPTNTRDTPLYTHPQRKRKPDGYFYTSHDWDGTRRDHSRDYPVSDAHTTYSDIEPYWLTPRGRGGEE